MLYQFKLLDFTNLKKNLFRFTTVVTIKVKGKLQLNQLFTSIISFLNKN